MTVVELLFATAVIIVALGVAVPQVLAGLDRARTRAAAQYLAQRCGLARLLAVSRARYVALQFVPRGGDFALHLIADGNRNGVRGADIAAAIDVPIAAGAPLSQEYAGVRIALDPALGLGSDPVRLGGSLLLSFSPSGTATAGTVYVLGPDRRQVAVRVAGATGRARVLAFNRSQEAWEEP